MARIICIVAVLFSTATVVTADSTAATQGETQKESSNAQDWQRYLQARQKALQEKSSIVIWINCAPKELKTEHQISVKSLKGINGPLVMVGVPDGRGDLDRIDLPANASLEQIQNAMNRKTRVSFYPSNTIQPATYTPSYYQPAPSFQNFGGYGGFGGFGGAGCST